MASGVLATGSTTSQIDIGTAVNYAYKGQFFQRATSASIAYPANSGSHTTLAAGQACSFLIVVDPASASALSAVQGPLVNVGDSCPVAAVPDGRVAIGALKVSNVTNPFVPGTTLLGAAGVTATYFNFATHPGVAI
jgi:hypothetical protein